ncbi:bifunctional DNA-formamidopyrimidine glycosylase/DNA-(apurinic or apyrimidinic site) lyase [Rubrobacter tropicus]|uniref:Bifunctional DNA-formamidopyrimidine glycosylase/DNA-(Apurinic or apyrimidinic site) lyase n=1 Tax=Rubrobacter tropicus TaxID=2653851 RepID=A0A6G8Q5K8_9ACTN|nr:bifunctional DNA-formamidopyrimidine glycosylase/DNA-(apurinic or apyrimidinic site) lyase [Rubrobacter tropicus]QIN81774.1 bifunctional DNA-formamidopyrimidine glycosylase/DNA-(apurinic or apyrimidinic site) lyase [Rubrobacter tropicus]
MPELPEVETIKRDLGELVVGARVEDVEIPSPVLVEHPSREDFVRRLRGARAAGARRRAKHLIVDLDSGDALVLQLKIGGQLLLVPPVKEPATALMLVLRLEGGRSLFLRDETGFTRARLLDAGELERRFEDLGPEPLGDEFRPGYLREKLGGRRARIKGLLLDQKVVAGVGNIYVDEALFDARIHPTRKANTLTEDEWTRLQAAVKENLRAGIEHRGTTFSLYRDVLGRKGHHQDHLKVFVQAGKPCPGGCGGKVVKEKVGGRATFLCPACQPEDGSGEAVRLEFG